MGKLAERLADPGRSGIYRVETTEAHEITSRAIAADGTVQPELRVENERGYGHNGWRDHAVKVTVA